MRTTGAPQVRSTSAGSQRCLRSCMRAVVRPCCCTYCCTELTLTRQASSAGVSPTSLAQLVLASSSRSQRARSPTTTLPCLTCLAPSVDVRWRPLVSVAVVTHLVTHPPRGAVVVATGPGHQPRTCLVMPEVVRRLVERRAAQPVVAAGAGVQEMTHALALRGDFPRWRADAGFPSDHLRPVH